jgi:hypothetical protein
MQQRLIAMTAAVSVALVACATPNSGSETAAPGTTAPGTAATTGALLGAAIGALTAKGGNRVQGAIIGGTAGFIAGYALDSYNVKKTKSAKEVDDAYRKSAGGQLPKETTITRYTTKLDPSAVVSRGNELRFASNIELVKGTQPSGAADKIEEELVLYDASGQNERRVKKSAVEKADASGAFSTQFVFKPSEGVAQGVYPFKTVLYLNDKAVRQTEGKFQVVMGLPNLLLAQILD